MTEAIFGTGLAVWLVGALVLGAAGGFVSAMVFVLGLRFPVRLLSREGNCLTVNAQPRQGLPSRRFAYRKLRELVRVSGWSLVLVYGPEGQEEVRPEDE